jgi:hypothetical protein
MHRVVQMMLDVRYETMLYPAKPMRPMDRSRKAILEGFLLSEAAYLVMIDSDNPPMNNVLDLIEFDKPVIGCPTPYYEYRSDELPCVLWNTFNYVDGQGRHFPPDERKGLSKVDFVGLGCVVIRRDVIEEIGIGALADSRDEHGVSRDDDDAKFHERCIEYGFGVWVHWDYCCRHVKGPVDLYDVLQCMEAKAALPETVNVPGEYSDAVPDSKLPPMELNDETHTADQVGSSAMPE